ncbi:MAG: sugar phosphate isomerase/epimerase [Anaerolineae bacterium]|nr:sugar phosphate isomerase/epimerase [Anaerolineae bacterium]
MKLGISSYTYSWAVGIPGHLPERPVRPIDLLARASALGVRVVQIADNMPLHLLPAAELEVLAEHAQDLGLDIEIGTRGILPAHLHTYLQLARQLKSSILRVVVDTAESHPTRAEIVRTITSFCLELEQAGVVLAIENHARFSART